MVPHEAPTVLRDRGERAQDLDQRRCLFADQRQSHRLVDVEVQAHVQFVAVLVAEEAALLLGLEIDLAEQDGVTSNGAQGRPAGHAGTCAGRGPDPDGCQWFR